MAGEDAVLVCRRSEQVLELARRGVTVYGEGGEGRAKVQAAHYTAVPRSSFDTVVVAVKAYDTVSVIETVRAAAKRGAVVVSVQNGLGPLELLERALGGSYEVYGAALYIGARRISDTEVEYTGGDRIVIGPRRRSSVPEPASSLTDVLRSAGFRAEAVGDIEPWRWDKLAVNAAINPITAILGVPNGALGRSESLLGLAENVVREVALVAEAENVKLPRDPVTALRETVTATSSNKSSMLQDIEARRPTEIEYINGAVVRLAVKHGIHVPYNEALYLLVKGLEDLYGIERPAQPPPEEVWRL